MKSEIFNYNGTNITFQLGNGDVMVNATEMAKPFGKSPNHFLRTQTTKDFINELSALRKCNPTDLVKVINGGNNFGTWMHEDVALEFSRWLSPKFAIWCNDRIKELLTKGSVALDLSDADVVLQLAQNFAEEQRKRIALEQKTALQSVELQKQAPKVAYHDEVLTSKSTHNTNKIAKELGMSAITLNRKLHGLGVQYKQNGTWLLYHKYQNKGYTKTETHTYTNSNGETKTSMQTVWTEKGREFIHSLLKKEVA